MPNRLEQQYEDERRQRAAKAAAKRAEDRRVNLALGAIIIPFIALMASGLIWLTAWLWVNMPWL